MKVYADNAATTKMCNAAVRAMIPFFTETYGNPSSIHRAGKTARVALEAAREVFADRLNADPREIVFTSGGSEANNQAIQSAARVRGTRHIISTRIEHHSVLNTLAVLGRSGFDITLLEVSGDGEVSPRDVEAAITPQTGLVSVMLANNEIGTIQPVEEIGKICRKHGVLFHVDAVQAAGHIEIDVKRIKADYLSVSAHKFNGPKGVGILYHRAGAPISPLIYGGGQEYGSRAGTENVAAAVGAATAFQEACSSMKEDAKRIEALRKQIEDAIRNIPGGCIHAQDAKNRLPGIVNAAFDGIAGEMLVRIMDAKGVFISSGSACSAGESAGSHVLKAIGVSDARAENGVRISLSRNNTAEEVEYLIVALRDSVIQARACGIAVCGDKA